MPACNADCTATLNEPMVISWAFQTPVPYVKADPSEGNFSITVYETVTLLVDEDAGTSSLVSTPSLACLNTYGSQNTATAVLSLMPGVTTTV